MKTARCVIIYTEDKQCMQKSVTIFEDDTPNSFEIDVIVDHYEYDAFRLDAECEFAAVDIRRANVDGVEIVDFIVLIRDDFQGFVIYSPDEENIEYVYETLTDGRVKFICDEDDIEVFNSRFGFQLGADRLIYDYTDSSDLVRFYNLAADSNINSSSSEAESDSNDFSYFMRDLPHAILDTVSGLFYLQDSCGELLGPDSSSSSSAGAEQSPSFEPY